MTSSSLEGAVEVLPDALFAELREGGRLVAVEGQGNAGVARIYLKSGGCDRPARL